MWQSIRHRWQLAGILARPGVTPPDLDAFERRHGVWLPPEMREFYAHLDGMPPGARDEESLNFWPLSQVGPGPAVLSPGRVGKGYGGVERAIPDAASYFVFVDHALWARVYAVRLSPDPSAAGPVV